MLCSCAQQYTSRSTVVESVDSTKGYCGDSVKKSSSVGFASRLPEREYWIGIGLLDSDGMGFSLSLWIFEWAGDQQILVLKICDGRYGLLL